MSSSLYPVACPFEDCLFHVTSEDPAGRVFCRHPEKARFSGSQACPLYQYNWEKKLDSLQR